MRTDDGLPPSERACRKCDETKPFVDFMACKTCKWGRSYWCKDCQKAYKREWWAQPEVSKRERAKLRAAAARRREEFPLQPIATARVRKAGAEIIDQRIFALVVLEMDDGVCGICGEDVDPFDFEIDHIVPIKKGGPHSYENVQVAHHACNVQKAVTVG